MTLTLQTVNPAELGVLDQARADATPDEQLVASVKQHGIMQPPTVAFDPEHGGYVIVIGHRRVGAAIAAGLTEITVIVRETDIDVDAVKLEQQIVENERRKALTAAELTQGYKRLELFGKTPAEIAAELGEKPERIRAGLKIHASAAAAKLVDEQPAIDFEQAAIIADFDEHPKLQRKLIETATTNPANFQRDVENSRTQREVDSRVAKLKEQLENAGVPLVEVLPYSSDWWSGKGVSGGPGRTLERLGIKTKDHAGCPGHAAVIHKAQSYYLAAKPNDWILYVCTDWEGNGHTTTAPEKDPEQLEREAQWEREKAERAARQELIEANTRARRTWLHGYLTTGRLRPTAAHFDLIAEALAAQIEDRNGPAAATTLELLTGEPPAPRRNWQDDSHEVAVVATIDNPASPNLRIIIANAIATFEDSIGAPRSVKYFAALAEWGYVLTDTDREHIEEARTLAAEEAGEGGTTHYDDEDPEGEA